jgi:ribosomal protein S14
MLFAKIKDKRLRLKFLKTEHKNKIYKYLFIKFSFLKTKINRKFIKKTLLILKKKSFYKSNKIKLIKRCIVNNRSRGVHKPFNMSRLIFRNLLQFGIIPGYKKAVW